MRAQYLAHGLHGYLALLFLQNTGTVRELQCRTNIHVPLLVDLLELVQLPQKQFLAP